MNYGGMMERCASRRRAGAGVLVATNSKKSEGDNRAQRVPYSDADSGGNSGPGTGRTSESPLAASACFVKSAIESRLRALGADDVEIEQIAEVSASAVWMHWATTAFGDNAT